MDAVFLPEPRLPHTAITATEGLPRGLHPHLDRYTADADDLIAATMAAAHALEDARPGGGAWREALARDGDDLIAGKLPTRTATETLLAGDAHRWAVASAHARTLTHRLAQLRQHIDNDAVVKAMDTLIDELVDQRRPLLHQAYAKVRTGDALDCQTLLRDADNLTDRIVLATRVHGWSTRANPAEPFNKATGYQFPGPQGRADYGHRFACRLELGERILTLPIAGRDIEWPAGYKLNGETVGMFFPRVDTQGRDVAPVIVPAVL